MSSQYVFGTIPKMKYSRSSFKLSERHLSSCNAGDLVPVYVKDIYPGDTFKIDATALIRTSSATIKNPMDNAFADMFFFFVPNRLVWEHWKECMGENNSSKWVQPKTFIVPQILPLDAQDQESVEKINTHDISFYMGATNGSMTYGSITPFSALPLRAYALIWNEWFRDENLQDPLLINFGDGNEQIDYAEFGSTPGSYLGRVAKINKVHDYFTSCLPAPQKGSAVDLPIGDVAPVVAGPIGVNQSRLSEPVSFSFSPGGRIGSPLNASTPFSAIMNGSRATLQNGQSTSATANSQALVPNNLQADLSEATAVSVNDLRFAFQLQKMLEKDARGGTRYTEYLNAHFGVENPDSRLQRSEYLGGARFPLTFTQVLQTSSTGSTGTPQANISGYSQSFGKCHISKSFTEHGFIIGLMAIRQYHTYQHGTQRFWQRKTRYDFYDPLFANIGEQPVYESEIYNAGGQEDLQSAGAFGYQEAWADLRCGFNRVSGELSSTYEDGSLDIWHFADKYTEAPTLVADWIKETPAYIDRTLAVSSSINDQFIFDVDFDVTAVRALPTYSVPGLIDHH